MQPIPQQTSDRLRRHAVVTEVDQWLRDFTYLVRLVDERSEGLPEAERWARRRDLVHGMIEARRRRGAEVPERLQAMLLRDVR